jgi:hypothetical protein
MLSIEELYFSAISIGSYGECTADHALECRDEQIAYEYARSACSGNQSCSLISYQLRAKTTCQHHHVISIYYKCVPTWEVTEVPIKCDICKNVTINVYNDMFGFIHSAWYPKLYPRLACASVVKNRPDHFILIYSVTGVLGLDRIIFETTSGIGQYGQPLILKETLTGNLTTQLVFMSENDVKINLHAEDTYFNEQRKFLLYFYLVPRCFIVECANKTTTPVINPRPPTYPAPAASSSPPAQYNPATSSSTDGFVPITHYGPSSSSSSRSTSAGYIINTISSSSSSSSSPIYSSHSGYISETASFIYGQTTKPTMPTTTASVLHSTYAPPLIANNHHNNKKPSTLSG